VFAPLHLFPSAAPSGTAAEGDVYFDDTTETLETYDGSQWNTLASLDTTGAQSFAGAATVLGNFTVGVSKFDVVASSGNTQIDGTLDVDGNFEVGVAKFNVTATTGDTQIDGTLDVDGVSWLEGSTGFKRHFQSGAGSLAESKSGMLCMWNAAAGFTYTLPAAASGLWFEFIVGTTCTSSVHRLACTSGDFLIGTILQSTDGTYVQAPQTANGSTHLAWEGNGTTTGGIIGDHFWVFARDSTLWEIYGINSATGTEATPFKTS
jgi:hypothetical protein